MPPIDDAESGKPEPAKQPQGGQPAGKKANITAICTLMFSVPSLIGT